MRFENVAILSVAHMDAPERLSSQQLEEQVAPALKRLGMPRGVLEALSGIKARRLLAPGQMPSDAATAAARTALARSGVRAGQVGILVNTSVCRDYVEPSTASIVHSNLKMSPGCLNFDIGNACLAFLNGMEVVGNMIERGQINYGLVVDGENSRFVLEQTVARLLEPSATIETFRENFATLTLGSGGAAMVLGRASDAPAAPRFTGSVTLAATEHNHLCRGQSDQMTTDSQGLLQAGVALAQRTWALGRKTLGWSPEVFDEVVMHQVSSVHTQRLTEALGLDISRVLALYPEFGNIGPASVPIALSKAVELGRVNRGSRVALMGIGSGLNCTMAEVCW